MERPLDLESWPRRPHFELFRRYENPFWSVSTEVDVDAVYRQTRQPDGPSFFLATLYLSIAAANEIEPFRYRLRGDGVIVHDLIHPGSTVLRADETFGFAYFTYGPDFPAFARAGSQEIERAVAASGLEGSDRDDLVYYSVLPWIRFSSFTHARRASTTDSIPRIVFGRHHEDRGRRRMPVAVDVHHALVDGLHVGRFVERFQALLDDADAVLKVRGET